MVPGGSWEISTKANWTACMLLHMCVGRWQHKTVTDIFIRGNQPVEQGVPSNIYKVEMMLKTRNPLEIGIIKNKYKHFYVII